MCERHWLFFVSYPINAAIGHRTGTHSFLALALCTVAVLAAESAGYADIGYGFLGPKPNKPLVESTNL